MQTMAGYFEDFRKAIEPDEARKKEAQAADDPVREHLATRDPFADRHETTFLYGSYRRSTAVGDIKDVDIVVVTNYTTDDEPVGVLQDLRDCLADLYPEPDLSDQRRSIRVDRPLPNVSGSSLTLDVIPAIYSGGPTDLLWVPDREQRQWVRSHPLAHIAYTSELNSRSYQGVAFVRLVKMVKWWWQHQHALKAPWASPSVRKPKGFWVEVMAGRYADLSKESYPELLASLFDRAFAAFKTFRTTGAIPNLPDPGLKGETVKTSMATTDFAHFLDTLEQSLAIAREAMNAPTERKASEGWRRLFGEAFPLAPDDTQRTSSLLGKAAVPSGLTFPDRPLVPHRPAGFA